MWSRRAVPIALVALSYLLAFVQRPGEVVADTKVHLYLDPARFLRNVLSLWASNPDLGHVWASQYGGYAWPMAPWFAAGDAIGLPVWIVHRLWLGTILALAAYGVVRLLDNLLTRRRGVVHVVAGVLYIANPYVTTYADRASVFLLTYVALPWMLLCVHRGLRQPRDWRWPALFALVLASAGGGVNAAATAWVLVGPALLVLYERFAGEIRPGAIRPFLARVVPVAIIANLWWVVPLLLAGRGAPNFLQFTEQPGTIWSTTTLPESLRLMGFWTSYVGVGYGGILRPYQGSASALLLLEPVVVASLLLPAVALCTLPWTRRWRYAPFFTLLALVGAMIMVVGWPEGTPLRRLVTGAYYRVDTLQPLRTTYKAGPLVALSMAMLAGAAFGVAWRRLPKVPLTAATAVIVALAAWPLVTGRAVERQTAMDVPDHWRQVAADLDRRPDGTRALILPGQLFANYAWGGPGDAVLPALTDHPVTTRWIVPFADLRSSELQFAVDGLVTQERLRPGQLRPLLDLLGVGDVLVAADGDRSRSGEMPPADAARVLEGAGGLRGGKAYGPTVLARPAADDIAAPQRTPSLRRLEVPTAGLVRVLPRGPETVLDGAAGAITGLAAYGALPLDRALRYAPDVGAAGLRAAARDGASFVISDTNRRRAFVPPRAKGNAGPTITPDQGISADGNIFDPFGDLTTAPQTTATLSGGVRSVGAPASPQVTQLPDQRPFAAVDGDPSTAWIGDRVLEPSRHVLTVQLDRPRDIGVLEVLPYSDSRAVVQAIEVDGRRFAVHRGWNRLAVGLRGVRSLQVRIAEVTQPRDAPGGAGGIRELRIPGVRAVEALRPPTTIETALRGADLSRSGLTYLLDRTTADVPARQRRYVGERGAGGLRDEQDPERVLRRVIAPPAARGYRVDGWGSIDPRTPDDVLDHLMAGAHARVRATSSSRFDGLGRYRASGAFDGTTQRAWIGQWIPGRPAWLAWTAPGGAVVQDVRLVAPAVRVRRPARVRLTVDGRRLSPVDVAPDGSVRLPAPVRGRDFRLDVLDARFPAGTPSAVRQRRAVGIAEVRGAGVPTQSVPRTGTVTLPCGVARIVAGGTTVALRATAARAAVDAGSPVRLHACGPLRLPAGEAQVTGSTAPVRVDGVRLSSPAARPAAVTGGGRVVDDGREQHGDRDGVRVDVAGPSWLVLGQSYDMQWRASCDGRDLGAPEPVEGYANGWPVDRGCRDVRFTYAPQRLADIAGAISLVGAAGLLALLAMVALRRRGLRDTPAEPLALADPPRARPLAPRHAVAVALPVAVVVAAVFGLRAGIVAAPAVFVILWRGVSDRVLALLAAALLGVAVPLVYLVVALLVSEDRLGGNSTQYGADRLAAHWLAVGAVVALAIILWRTLAAVARRQRVPIASRR